jgi:hypothetical protein
MPPEVIGEMDSAIEILQNAIEVQALAVALDGANRNMRPSYFVVTV